MLLYFMLNELSKKQNHRENLIRKNFYVMSWFCCVKNDHECSGAHILGVTVFCFLIIRSCCFLLSKNLVSNF